LARLAQLAPGVLIEPDSLSDPNLAVSDLARAQFKLLLERRNLEGLLDEARREGIPPEWLADPSGAAEPVTAEERRTPDTGPKQAQWTTHFAKARERIVKAEQAEAKARDDLAMGVHPRRPAPTRVVGLERAVEYARREVERAKQALAALEEEARRAGVPPVWTRD
jgi:hypothetical protein